VLDEISTMEQTYTMEKITIVVLLGLTKLYSGQVIQKSAEEINKRDLSYMETFVLENVHRPIMCLAESQIKRQSAMIDRKIDALTRSLNTMNEVIDKLNEVIDKLNKTRPTPDSAGNFY